MFSSAVSVGIRLYAWNTNPTCSRRSSVSSLSLSVGEIRLADVHGAFAERVEAGEAVQQRRLAGSRRTHDRREPAGLERDRHAVEGVDGGVADPVDLLGVDRAGGGSGRGRCGGGRRSCRWFSAVQTRTSSMLARSRRVVGRRSRATLCSRTDHAFARRCNALRAVRSRVDGVPVLRSSGAGRCPFLPRLRRTRWRSPPPRAGVSSPSCSPTSSGSRRSPSSATRNR